MKNEEKIGVVKKLSEKQKTEIQGLEKKLYLAQGLRYKIDPQIYGEQDGKYDFFLAYQKNDLVGCIVLASFDADVPEATPLLTDESVFTQLLNHVINVLKERGGKNFLMILNQGDLLLRELALKNEFREKFVEHRMFLSPSKFLYSPENPVMLRAVAKQDIAALAALNEGEEPILEADLESFSVAIIDGEVVGRIRVEKAENLYGIYGFTVRKDLRGKGIGRKIICQSIAQLPGKAYGNVYLEVAGDNAAALHLYDTVGFEIQSTFCYFSRTL
ncbi:MAG: GNAT family N-acetyltransferase [Oscillospiraceae bacterium]